MGQAIPDADVESTGGEDEPAVHPHAQGRGGGEGASEAPVDGMGPGCMAATRLALRAAEFVFSLISFSLVASFQGSTFGWALQDSSVAFLLAMGVITFLYSIATIVLLLLALFRPDSDLSFRLPRPLLIADFVLLVMFISAASSSAGLTTACARGFISCGLLSGGVAMGFLASFTLVADFWLTLIPVMAEI